MSARFAMGRSWPGAGVRGFLDWWGAGLVAWLPARLRDALVIGNARLVLQAEGEVLRLQLWRGGAAIALAALPLPMPAGDPLAGLLRGRAKVLPRWLQVPDALGLRRLLVLPAAARDRLRDVLAFEVERQTPFSLADVLFDGRIVQVRADGQLQVELVVVPRRQYADAVAPLGGLAAQLAGIDLVDARGAALGVNLLPPTQRQAHRDPWRRWNMVLGVAGLLVLAAGLAQLLDNRRAAASDLQARLATREASARAFSTQRQRVVDAIDGAAYLEAQRRARPPVVEVMAALAQRLPDDTYLERLAIDGDQMTVIGLSNQAAALVGKLEGASQWRAPALSGALQRDPRARMDRFALVARLEAGSPASVERGTP